MLKKLIMLMVIYSPLSAYGSQDLLSSMMQQGTLLRLQRDYEGADRVRDQLFTAFPTDAIGYVFNLNTLVTRISWDPSQKIYDEALLNDAEQALRICSRGMAAHPENFQSYYYCGQAHFALTFLHAIRGNHYQAGKNGALTIKRLEQTLVLEPQLVDAKMHLGLAYYYADNLPPFVKALSHLLWFIPTGNSEKSLPYLEAVTRKGQYFKDVAKFIYSDLLIDGERADRDKAALLLGQLVRSYPQNGRFQLRLMALLMEMERFQETIQAANAFLNIARQHQLSELDCTLAKLWATRAYVGLNNTETAQYLFEDVDAYFEQTREIVPQWTIPWRLLTRAQLQDLQNHRLEAISSYKQIIDLGKSSLVGVKTLTAAQEGLKTPYPHLY
ncbi:MAG: hypothetical protein QGD92_09370 [Gammaproteobacteria bacterium]|nr:hypothetical protein [Gammaproteobacteria bacterium]